MGMSPTELGVPPHLEALSCRGKPHPGRMSRQRWAEWRRQEGEERILDSLGRVGVGVGVGFAGERTEKQTREEQDAAPCEGLRRSLLTDWMSLPVTSV